jgi:hypothetical protein
MALLSSTKKRFPTPKLTVALFVNTSNAIAKSEININNIDGLSYSIRSIKPLSEFKKNKKHLTILLNWKS